MNKAENQHKTGPGIRCLRAGVLALSLAGSGTVALAQTDRATDVLREEIEAVLAAPVGGPDRQVKVVDIGPINVAVGVLHRGRTESSDAPVRGIAHTDVAEVYYVTSGGGTLITGVDVVDPRALDPTSEVVEVAVGPSLFGQFVSGAQREITAGDVVVIPAGVFHGWVEVPDHVTYVSVRPDPDRVLPAGYVNPAINAGTSE